MFYSLVASSYSVFVRSASFVSRSTSRFVAQNFTRRLGAWCVTCRWKFSLCFEVIATSTIPPIPDPTLPASQQASHSAPLTLVTCRSQEARGGGATNPGPPVECGQTNKPPLGQRPTRRNDRTNELFVGHVGHMACTLRELRTRDQWRGQWRCTSQWTCSGDHEDVSVVWHVDVTW